MPGRQRDGWMCQRGKALCSAGSGPDFDPVPHSQEAGGLGECRTSLTGMRLPPHTGQASGTLLRLRRSRPA